MKAAWLWVFPLMIVAVIAAGVVSRTGTGQKIVDAWIDGPQEDRRGQAASISLGIEADGRVVLTDGEERIAVGWTRTGVTTAQSQVSGVLTVMNQDQGATGGTPVERCSIDIAGIQLVMRDVTPYPDWHFEFVWGERFEAEYEAPDSEEPYVWVVFIAMATEEGGAEFEVVDYFYHYTHGEDGPDLEYEFSMSVTGAQLERRETQTPDTTARPQAAGIAYSQEVGDESRWVTIRPAAWSASIGPLSTSGVQSLHGEVWKPGVETIESVAWRWKQHHTVEDVDYGGVQLEWDDVEFDLSRYERDFGTWQFEGVSDGISVYSSENALFVDRSEVVSILRPYIIDTSDFYVGDLDGNLAADLCLDLPVQASNHYPASLGWATTPDGLTFGATPGQKVYPTVAQFRAVGQYIDPPAISGLEFRDPDDEHKLLTSATFTASVTEESVRYHA